MKKILENVFKIVYNGIGNDTDTLKQKKKYLKIYSVSTKVFSTGILVEKNKKKWERYRKCICFESILLYNIKVSMVFRGKNDEFYGEGGK